MGNCVVIEEKVIKIMKPDGKVLEYRAPMKVYQVLSQFSGHVISETADQVVHHLKPETKLLGGHFYYLVPLPQKQPQGSLVKQNKKKVRFSNPEVEDSIGQDSTSIDSNSTVVRIKLVISKQELQEMLKRGGVSIDDMLSELHGGKDLNGFHRVSGIDGDCEGWKPVLDSIAEVN